MPTTTSWPRRLGASVLACSIAGVVALAATPAHADPGDDKPDFSQLGSLVDDVVPKILADGDVPGAAVSIVSGDKELYAAGYGVADVDSRAPVDPKTTGFYAASTAKLFTAAAVLQLADAGKLDLHADVNDYLTTFKIPDTYPGKPVTLDNLLTHTAGFDPDYGMLGSSQISPEGLESLGTRLADRLPARVNPPGTVLAYDNFGVALAGYIVEAVSGRSYDEYVNTQVFGALDMAGSTASQPHPAAIEKALAKGYRPDGDKQVETTGQYNPWSPSGPGQVVTAADMGRFMIDQFSANSRLGDGIPAQMQQQHYAQDDRMPGMGYIYEERPHNGLKTLFKGGDTQGFHSDMVLLPEQKLGIFIVVNGDGNDDFDQARLAETIIDEYYPTEPDTTPKPIPEKDVSQYEGSYQTSRTSHHSLIKARAFTQSLVEVAANPDGTLTTTDRTLSTHSDVDSQDWVQIDEGLFQEVDGPGTIAFNDGIITESRGQNQVYLKLAWYEKPAFHLTVLVVSLVGLLIGLLAFPITALVRRLRGLTRHPRTLWFARLLAWLTAAGAVACIAGVGALLADQARAVEVLTLGSSSLIALMIGASLVVLASIAVCGLAVVAWWHGWWQAPGRLAYSLMALACAAFSTITVTYNLVGPPFD